MEQEVMEKLDSISGTALPAIFDQGESQYTLLYEILEELREIKTLLQSKA